MLLAGCFERQFDPGYPVLDVVVSAAITAATVAVIAGGGLLATIAALATHFILLRAPITIDLTSWRARQPSSSWEACSPWASQAR